MAFARHFLEGKVTTEKATIMIKVWGLDSFVQLVFSLSFREFHHITETLRRVVFFLSLISLLVIAQANRGNTEVFVLSYIKRFYGFCR